jgi:hypothetical protein
LVVNHFTDPHYKKQLNQQGTKTPRNQIKSDVSDRLLGRRAGGSGNIVDWPLGK